MQVTCTPSFIERDTEGIRITLEALRRFHISDTHCSGWRLFQRGRDVQFRGFTSASKWAGRERNARISFYKSSILIHTLLLTGDLEGSGQSQLLQQQSHAVDVLMAPHHEVPPQTRLNWQNGRNLNW